MLSLQILAISSRDSVSANVLSAESTADATATEAYGAVSADARSGEITAGFAALECLERVCRHSPTSAFQILAAWSCGSSQGLFVRDPIRAWPFRSVTFSMF